jgi:8-oxo-dGTP pyrophosphatase MutT (NUDIX family)
MTRIVDAPAPISSLADPSTGASAALIVTPDRRFLLQHRDEKAGIWFPGSWGLFGGAIEVGETPGQALQRELAEEIGFVPHEISYFTQIAWDFARWGLGIKLRYTFEVPIGLDQVSSLVLREGQGMRFFSADEVLREPCLTPYDDHALRMYIEATPVGVVPRRF